jgi:capsular exopolysaccharide synthesis family protein
MNENSNGTGPHVVANLNFSQSSEMRDFIMRYLRYLPWLIVCFALSLVVAYIKIRYTVPIYHVQSTLLIKNDAESSPTGKDDRLGELFMAHPTTNLNNEIEVLRSSPVIARVVKDLGLQVSYYIKGSVRSSLLYKESPFTLQVVQMQDPTTGFEFAVTGVNDQHFAIVDKSGTTHAYGEPFKVGNNVCVLTRNFGIDLKIFPTRDFYIDWQPAIEAARGLAGSIRIAQLNDFASILTLSIETENVTLGQDMLNTLMAVYDSLIIEDKNRIAINTMKFIDDRLSSLRDSLGGVEGNLRSFMEKNGIFDITSQSKEYITGISDGAKNLETSSVQLSILDWLIEYISKPENTYNAVPTNLGIAEPSLLQLFTDYNKLQLQRETNLKTAPPDNPMIKSMDASLERLRQNMLQALQNIRQANLITRSALSLQNNQFQGQLQAMPGKSQHQLAIQRQEEILQELYYFLLQKKLETSISSASTISNSKVVEPAVGGTEPIIPNHNSLYMSYAIIGLIIPIAFIVVVELMSDKVANRMEIQKATDAPILGEIGHSEDEKTLVVTTNSRRFIAEQFRIIRTNLRYITGKNETPVILVTSSFSGEGKSFVSTNMGAVMALAGKKTVVMEFDIRKPKIISGLDLKRKMGITNYIIGSASFEDLPVKVEGVDNFYVIPCGPIPPNPAELLLSPRLAELIEFAKRNFEVVILDTAPIGLVSDAINLASFADCTIYIVRRGHTPRRLLGLVNDLYINKKLPSLSILLNDVKADGSQYGGYYGGYGYYGYGYNKNGGYFEDNKLQKGFVNRIKGTFSRWFG